MWLEKHMQRARRGVPGLWGTAGHRMGGAWLPCLCCPVANCALCSPARWLLKLFREQIESKLRRELETKVSRSRPPDARRARRGPAGPCLDMHGPMAGRGQMTHPSPRADMWWSWDNTWVSEFQVHSVRQKMVTCLAKGEMGRWGASRPQPLPLLGPAHCPTLSCSPQSQEGSQHSA